LAGAKVNLLLSTLEESAACRPNASTGSPQRIAYPREVFPGEKRVATVPDVVEKLIKLGFAVFESKRGAGDLGQLQRRQPTALPVLRSSAVPPTVWATSDIVFKVRAPQHR